MGTGPGGMGTLIGIGKGWIGDHGEVSQFLSPEWRRELQEAAGADEALCRAAQRVRLTVAHVVTGGPAGDVTYRVRMGDGRVEVLDGPGEADVEVHQDYETASSVSRGQITPVSAFTSGRMRLGGRPGLLAEHRDAMARLSDAFAALRARTTY